MHNDKKFTGRHVLITGAARGIGFEIARQFAYKLELDPTACALSGGEDYELLFTVDQNDFDKISSNPQISIVGYITEKEENSVIITRGGNKYPLTAQGWNALK